MVFKLFGAAARADAKDAFWKWFQDNESRLFAVETDREALFGALDEQLHRVHPDLCFEFGPLRNDGRREFVISAGGMRAAFESVEALHRRAPRLRRWIWVKFRQRSASLCDIQFDGLCLRAQDVRFVMARDGDRVGLLLYLDGYREADRGRFGQIGYLFLDHALGEYAVETQVGFIDFRSFDSEHFEQSRPLEELAACFDDFWRRAAH